MNQQTSWQAGSLTLEPGWQKQNLTPQPHRFLHQLLCLPSPVASWAYKVSLKPHHQARKASFTVKGGTVGTCQPLVGLGHTSLPVGCDVGNSKQHIPFLHRCCSLPSYTPYAPFHSFLHFKFFYFIFKQPD